MAITASQAQDIRYERARRNAAQRCPNATATGTACAQCVREELTREGL